MLFFFGSFLCFSNTSLYKKFTNISLNSLVSDLNNNINIVEKEFENVVNNIKNTITPLTYNTFIKDIKFVRFYDGILEISVPNEMIYKTLNKTSKYMILDQYEKVLPGMVKDISITLKD